VDADTAQQIVVNAAILGVDIPVDYEHQSLVRTKAPAAGWIKPAAIEAKQYRYFSPCFDFKKRNPKTGQPMGAVLHSIGLTNTPLLAGDISPLVAAKAETGGLTVLAVACRSEATGEKVYCALTPEDAEVARLFGTPLAEFAQAKLRLVEAEQREACQQNLVLCSAPDPRRCSLSDAQRAGLSTAEINACRRLGLSYSDYAKTKRNEQG